MDAREDLEALLRRIEGRSYKAYGELRHRAFALESRDDPSCLFVDTVQGDPFAAPSRVRLRVSIVRAGIPRDLYAEHVPRVALEDFVARAMRERIRHRVRGHRGSGGSGRVEIDAGGQTVLERTAVRIGEGWIEARLAVGLPAAGRRVLASEARALLLEELPALAEEALCMPALSEPAARHHVETVENHTALQTQLAAHGLVAFVADGSILPRETGASDRPPPAGAVAFRSPESLRVTLELAHPIREAGGATRFEVSGLGIPEGVTLIVGGGYHGKSTLLRALERGVHPHLPGDGRERVATRSSGVKIRAEDGRRVEGCDISGFIRELPRGLGGSCPFLYRLLLDGRRQRQHQPGRQHRRGAGDRDRAAAPRRGHLGHQLHGPRRADAGPGPPRARADPPLRGSRA